MNYIAHSKRICGIFPTKRNRCCVKFFYIDITTMKFKILNIYAYIIFMTIVFRIIIIRCDVTAINSYRDIRCCSRVNTIFDI